MPMRAVGALAPSGFPAGAAVADAGQDDGITVGKLHDKGEPAAYGFDIVRQRGQQHIRALFETRRGVLGDPHASGETDLRASARAEQLLPGHSSAINWFVRASNLRRRAGLKSFLMLSRVFIVISLMHLAGGSFLTHLKTRVDNPEQSLTILDLF
jgi:hypothetical protein